MRDSSGTNLPVSDSQLELLLWDYERCGFVNWKYLGPPGSYLVFRVMSVMSVSYSLDSYISISTVSAHKRCLSGY